MNFFKFILSWFQDLSRIREILLASKDQGNAHFKFNSHPSKVYLVWFVPYQPRTNSWHTVKTNHILYQMWFWASYMTTKLSFYSRHKLCMVSNAAFMAGSLDWLFQHSGSGIIYSVGAVHQAEMCIFLPHPHWPYLLSLILVSRLTSNDSV